MSDADDLVQLAHFDPPPGQRSHKDMDVFWHHPNGAWGTDQLVSFATGCCGCETTITAAQFEELIAAWQNRGIT